MIKLAGSILITGAMASLGLAAAQRLVARTRVLSELLSALEIMQAEIYFRLTPIPEIAEALVKAVNGDARAMFTSVVAGLKELGDTPLSVIWKRAASENLALLKPDELSVITELGAGLGRYDMESQTNAISYARRRLEAYLRDAQEERKRQVKVYGAAGLFCGLAIMIIFI